MRLISINPATGRILRRYRAQSAREAAASAAGGGLPPMAPPTGFTARARHLRAVAGVLRGELEAHARLITTEMGKPLAQARAEIEKCALVCDHYCPPRRVAPRRQAAAGRAAGQLCHLPAAGSRCWP